MSSQRVTMIVIEILNIEKIVERESGQFGVLAGSLGVDLEARVEQQIIRRIKKVFEDGGVEAKLMSVGGVKSTTYTRDSAA